MRMTMRECFSFDCCSARTADVAAKIAFDAVVQHLKYSRMQSLVTFCCFARADRERYAAMIAALRD